jgi:hypothetical protein
MTRTLFAVVVAMILSACGGGASNVGGSEDPRVAAIQTALAAPPHGTMAAVEYGQQCTTPWQLMGPPPPDPRSYAHIPGAHVVKDGMSRPDILGKRYACFSVTWDPAVATLDGPRMMATLGRYLVDKVGDEQDSALGKITPYRAHFEPNPTGTALIAARLATKPEDIADGQALLHKNADGAWVAQL